MSKQREECKNKCYKYNAFKTGTLKYPRDLKYLNKWLIDSCSFKM